MEDQKMMPIINMIESGSVVIPAVLFIAFLGDRLDRSFWAKSIVFGIVFGATGLVSMASPVELAPGFFADGRNVVVAFSGVIGGPISAMITAAVLSAMRMTMGAQVSPPRLPASGWSPLLHLCFGGGSTSTGSASPQSISSFWRY
ncbi:hypothetical protein N8D56_26370 (plasmid) [Devosia sp. A8/3-2]|nr:hypothetical protein N8D56_26370 [Devosia sp. A8/3-2]